MPVYKFRGKRYETGEAIMGERFAQSKQTLASALRNERIMPIQINEKTKQLSFRLRAPRVSSKELSLFTRQFSVMLDSGLPLVQCLGILAEEQDNKFFTDVLNQVRSDVEAGSTLADAMGKHPRVFDNLFVNMISAGEAGGILDEILRRLSVFLEKNVKLKRAVLSASVYPSIIIAVAMIVVFVIMVWVIPVFATLFQGLDFPLPLPTRIVMATSSFMAQFSIPIILAVVLGSFGMRSYYRTDSGKLAIDRFLLTIPIVGVVLKKIAIARFSRTLATLMSSGIPILEGLTITANTAGNVVIQNALMDTRREVEKGKTLVEPLKKMTLFPSMVTQIIGVGEQTGELDQMLQKLADFYEDEADAAVANLLTVLEPVMIVFLGVVIGGIVISMYMPMFTLIGRLSTAS